MTGKELMLGMGCIDERFFQEALTTDGSRQKTAIKHLAAAAVFVLIAAAVILALRGALQRAVPPEVTESDGTSETFHEPGSESAWEIAQIQADWPYYESTEELIAHSDLIFTGEVTGISFQMLDSRTALPPTDETDRQDVILYTIYDISVTKQFKGQTESTEQIRIIGGLADSFFEEQLDALGENADPVIPVVAGHPDIQFGETYLFLLAQSGNTLPTPVNMDQSIYRMDGQDPPSNTEAERILSYLQKEE